MTDYKPNSHKSKENVKEKKVEQVTKAKIKKKNSIAKAASSIISEDANNVKSYILMDILIPAFKKAISDIVTNGIDMILYGEEGHSKKSKTSYISYDRFSSDKKEQKYRVNKSYSMDDIILDSRGEASEVLTRMDELIDTYGFVTIADLYDLIGVSCNYTDNKYGWTSLRTAEIVRIRDGYRLKLPKAYIID